MLKFEIKKVFSKARNKVAVLVLLVVLVVVSMLTINRIEYTDASGNSSTGITAATKLRQDRNQWAGPAGTGAVPVDSAPAGGGMREGGGRREEGAGAVGVLRAGPGGRGRRPAGAGRGQKIRGNLGRRPQRQCHP